MAYPIISVIETIKILIEQSPVYAQTPLAQKVIEWVNTSLEAVTQYDENHKLHKQVRREFPQLQEHLADFQQAAIYTGAAFLYHEGQTPQQILRKMEQQAKIEAKERNRQAEAQTKSFQRELRGDLTQLQIQTADAMEIWQQQMEEATRSPQIQTADAMEIWQRQMEEATRSLNYDPMLEKLNPDIAAQMRELNRFNSNNTQHMGPFSALSLIDDIPFIAAVALIRIVRNLSSRSRQPHDNQKQPTQIGENEQVSTTPITPAAQASTATRLLPSELTEPGTKPVAPIQRQAEQDQPVVSVVSQGITGSVLGNDETARQVIASSPTVIETVGTPGTPEISQDNSSTLPTTPQVQAPATAVQKTVRSRS